MEDRAAIVILSRGRVLLMRRHKAGRRYHALPGGKIEPGETPEQTVLRETREETGLTVTLAGKLAEFVNEGRTEHYYLAGSHRGRARLGGPELARRSPENDYALEWVDLYRLDEVKLMPPAAVEVVRQAAAGASAGRREP
ncbi:MAG TPA: NUDIX domain-containing protein [Phycisphaerae bacterium]|nr:NUDIX domain-containing protein [Phycisphaerae bacterium]HUT60422.1 NUDIX domain-containing protein [Phycisphaerae bacterium]